MASKFIQKCKKIIIENNTSAVCFGTSNSEWSPSGTNTKYAEGDSRVPSIIGSKKKRKNKKQKIKILRRAKI